MSQNPLAVAIGVSLAFHVLLLAAALLFHPQANVPVTKRGEPLFVELPEAEQPAQRGAPPDSSPKAPATPPTPTVKAPPQPKVAASPPKPSPVQPRPAPPRAPEPPTVARAPVQPPTPEPPAAEGLPSSKASSKPPEPTVNEPVQPPEAVQREATPREAAPATPTPPRVAAVPPSRPPVVDSLSALRRGGPGGAGGAGEGWAGIEGEPIPLDSPEPRLRDYLDRVRRMIKDKWVWQCLKDRATGECEHKAARLIVEFGILRDGAVPAVVVRKPSEYEIMDEWAVNAIKLASPFPPVPQELMAMAKPGSTGVRIQAHFAYIVEPVRILR